MAGYKQQVVDDDAASLWSFDGDAFDQTTRKLIVPDGDPRVIIDEIDNQNPAILHSDHELYLGYRMGMPSMIVHEQEDQYSMTFGYYGNIPAHPSGYPKAYLEIPHTTTYSFPRLGSFSVEFMWKITSNPSTYGSYPIFVKSGVIDISYVVNPSSSYLNFSHPGGVASLGYFSGSSNIFTSIINQVFHVAFVWDVIQIANNQYQGTAYVYLNGRLYSKQVYNYLDTFPNTNVSTPITICGTSTLYWKSACQMDQIAVYDKPLSADEVIRHVSKAYPYDQFLKNDGASNIWPFDDADSLVNFEIAPYYGNHTGVYVGGRGRCLRGGDGPSGIIGSSCCTFVDGGQASFASKNSSSAYSPRNEADYTYEWWFNTTESQRGVMLSIQTLEFPFNGPLVQMNVRDHQFSIGSIQYSVEDTYPVLNSRYLDDNGERMEFNDGKWHHIAITRQLNTGICQLYLDGILHDQQTLALPTVGHPGQLMMMNSMPGRLKVHGSLSFLAAYGFDLQDHQIRARANYSIIYKIRGIVTLLGVPYRAKLRFYSSYTGEFIQEVESDPDTGEYEVQFYNNSNIDILVFDPNDLSVRYRAYGPVKPSEFDDLPIII